VLVSLCQIVISLHWKLVLALRKLTEDQLTPTIARMHALNTRRQKARISETSSVAADKRTVFCHAGSIWGGLYRLHALQ